jgi:hypothetical protein
MNETNPDRNDPSLEIAKHAIESCLAQREEIMLAFVAKHGFQAEDAIQIERRQPDGTSHWMIERRPRPDASSSATPKGVVAVLVAADGREIASAASFEVELYQCSQASLARQRLACLAIRELAAPRLAKCIDDRMADRIVRLLCERDGCRVVIIPVGYEEGGS